MKITIDGKVVEYSPNEKNIIDVADKAKIGIPAPCYRINMKKGCCNACIIEVDGEQKYACATQPTDGMNIIFNRDDLKSIRKRLLVAYQKGENVGQSCACCCSSGSNCC